MKRFLVALLAASAAYAQTYAVAGVVVQPDGRPAKRVRVAIAPSNAREDETAVISGPAGEFRFALPAGKYHLTAEPPNRGVQTYGQQTLSKGFGTAIVTGPDFQNEKLVFRLIPTVVIHGRVTDTSGDPVENALVQAYVSAIVRGRRSVFYIGYRNTDDRGEYRFTGLRDGTYYVSAGGTPWYVSRLQNDQSLLARGGYATTYFPATRDPRAATPLDVKPGESAEANLTLATAPGVELKVTPQTPKKGTVRVDVMCEGVGGSVGFAYVANSYGGGPAVIRGVQPGRYIIRASMQDGTARLYGSREIAVGNQDADATVTLAGSPPVTGRLKMLDGATVPEDTFLELENEIERVHMRRPIAPDGAFSFEGLAPGKYRPLIGAAQRPIYLRSVALDGAPMREEMIEIARPAQLELTASLRGGNLRGEVYRAGKPVVGALALLAPARESANPLDYRAFETDADGSFEWEALPPGDYLLIVKEDWFDLEWAKAEALRPLAKGGRPVRVEAAGTEKMRIQLP